MSASTVDMTIIGDSDWGLVSFENGEAELSVTKDWWHQEGEPERLRVTVEPLP